MLYKYSLILYTFCIYSILSGSIETLEFLCKELHINPNRGPKDWEPGKACV